MTHEVLHFVAEMLRGTQITVEINHFKSKILRGTQLRGYHFVTEMLRGTQMTMGSFTSSQKCAGIPR